MEKMGVTMMKAATVEMVVKIMEQHGGDEGSGLHDLHNHFHCRCLHHCHSHLLHHYFCGLFSLINSAVMTTAIYLFDLYS